MTPRRRAAKLLATWFGCGLAPKAPGTVGSIGALPLNMVLRRINPVAHGALVLGITAVGIWCADEMADELGVEDPQIVVIDEVAGALIAMGMVRRRSLSTQLLALALFRVFDITKPGPVGAAERARPPGLGIMLDDVVAGLMAGFLTRWARRR
jgi:phosphatidylglycerophosphatase A